MTTDPNRSFCASVLDLDGITAVTFFGDTLKIVLKPEME